MKVFNLTDKHIDYRGKTMRAYGSEEYPDLVHVPNRDLLLQEEGLLAFGKLPKGWEKPQPKAVVEVAPAAPVVAAPVDAAPAKVMDVPKVEAPPPPKAEEPKVEEPRFDKKKK